MRNLLYYALFTYNKTFIPVDLIDWQFVGLEAIGELASVEIVFGSVGKLISECLVEYLANSYSL